MSKFMVTGGAGFIGSHIVELLLAEQHEVVVYDNFSTGRECNLEPFADCINIVRADIRDAAALDTAMAGVNYVIHHAAEISAIKSVEDPLFANEVNVTGTLNLLSAARKNGAKRMVLASSSAIYGDTGKAPQSEMNLPHPLSPYGATKICGEHYCTVFNEIYGLETVRLRYFNVYGPRQNPKSQYAAVIPKFIDKILAGQALHIYGDGEQTRDFVYVKDIARANYMACLSDKAPGEVFNIAGGRCINVNELAELLMSVTGKQVEIIHDAPVVGEIKYSASDITKAREVLGFSPKVTLEQGLSDVVAYFGG
ncbi:MAG: SDR family oxidoreductase [Armatimonadota bacterium]|nr:SDR family oxidoreductase [bacterium]